MVKTPEHTGCDLKSCSKCKPRKSYNCPLDSWTSLIGERSTLVIGLLSEATDGRGVLDLQLSERRRAVSVSSGRARLCRSKSRRTCPRTVLYRLREYASH